METMLGGIIVALLGQTALLWWRIGKLEGKVESICDRLKGRNNPVEEKS